MKTLQEISGGFHAAYNDQEKRRDAIKAEAEKRKAAAQRYQRLAARKMGEYYKLYEIAGRARMMGWTDGLLRPLLDEIEARTGWEFDNKNDLRTFGLRAECPTRIKTGEVDERGFETYKAYIIFTPCLEHNDDGTWHYELWYDTGEKKAKRSPAGSIAELNGFDNMTARVESVEQVIEFLRKQMEE